MCSSLKNKIYLSLEGRHSERPRMANSMQNKRTNKQSLIDEIHSKHPYDLPMVVWFKARLLVLFHPNTQSFQFLLRFR